MITIALYYEYKKTHSTRSNRDIYMCQKADDAILEAHVLLSRFNDFNKLYNRDKKRDSTYLPVAISSVKSKRYYRYRSIQLNYQKVKKYLGRYSNILELLVYPPTKKGTTSHWILTGVSRITQRSPSMFYLTQQVYNSRTNRVVNQISRGAISKNPYVFIEEFLPIDNIITIICDYAIPEEFEDIFAVCDNIYCSQCHNDIYKKSILSNSIERSIVARCSCGLYLTPITGNMFELCNCRKKYNQRIIENMKIICTWCRKEFLQVNKKVNDSNFLQLDFTNANIHDDAICNVFELINNPRYMYKQYMMKIMKNKNHNPEYVDLRR